MYLAHLWGGWPGAWAPFGPNCGGPGGKGPGGKSPEGAGAPKGPDGCFITPATEGNSYGHIEVQREIIGRRKINNSSEDGRPRVGHKVFPASLSHPLHSK